MILLAVEEAVANVIEHAFEPFEKASFQVILEPLAAGLKIIVKDKGLPYEPSLIPAYSVGVDIENAESGGLGSYLMKQSMDEVSFHNLGKEGKELHLTRYLPFRKITEYHGAAEADLSSSVTPQPASLSWNGHMEIRLTRPTETVEVSRLFYRSYGYSYVLDSIYYPDRFARLIEKGEIISAVAVLGENEIVGHGGLEKEEGYRRIAEAGMAATKPVVRGHGGMTRIVEFLIDHAKAAGMDGLYARAVADHPYSQKTGFTCGFRDCGIVLGLGLPETDYKDIVGPVCQRVSTVYSFLPLTEMVRSSLYPPERHRQLIEAIYENMGIDVITAPSDEYRYNAPETSASLKSRLILCDARAEIVVTGGGSNTVTELSRALKDLLRQKVEQICLFLDLEDPLTASLCKESEGLGFFFSAVVPRLHFDHCLVLQYLNNITLDYSKLKIASDFGKRILDYIRKCDPNT